MLLKIIVILLLLVVFYSLGSALFFMVRTKASEKKTVQFLTWRIGLSLFIFALLIFAFFMGWITPHGLMLAPV